MFREAIRIAAGFTNPVVISTRFDSGEIQRDIGAFVILNSDGWALTCNHIFQVANQAEVDTAEVENLRQQREAISDNPKLSPQQKRNQLKRLRPTRKLITNHSYWWGQDSARLAQVKGYPWSDLALLKLEGFDISNVPAFPVFGDPNRHAEIGTPLCKLGYPFIGIESQFDSNTGNFVLTFPGLLPRFPLEGMFTREVSLVNKDTGESARFIETSSPGLRGQSGGPIFDEAGVVWGIQSRTQHLDLDFAAQITRDGRTHTEHQVMNVGWGADITEIMRVVGEDGIEVQAQAEPLQPA